MNFEPEDEEALNMIIPKYVTSLIYGGLVEAAASFYSSNSQLCILPILMRLHLHLR